jgi:hypothetical protein
MSCHICGDEAVARCYNCGQLMCEKHGSQNCTQCDAGFAAGDPRADRITAAVTSPTPQKPGWWRPQEAEEYKPPACYACGGLCRAKCRICESRYCRDHAGPNGLCKACGGTAWLGPAILGLLAAFMALILLWNWLAG